MIQQQHGTLWHASAGLLFTDINGSFLDSKDSSSNDCDYSRSTVKSHYWDHLKKGQLIFNLYTQNGQNSIELKHLSKEPTKPEMKFVSKITTLLSPAENFIQPILVSYLLSPSDNYYLTTSYHFWGIIMFNRLSTFLFYMQDNALVFLFEFLCIKPLPTKGLYWRKKMCPARTNSLPLERTQTDRGSKNVSLASVFIPLWARVYPMPIHYCPSMKAIWHPMRVSIPVGNGWKFQNITLSHR